MQIYTDYVTELTKWFDSSHLLLNVFKGKGMYTDSNKNNLPNSLLKPVTVNSQEVEQVSSFKYVGTVLGQAFTFSEHVGLHLQKITR